ncbi:glycosyltransferase [Occallatibacter savannae]|uniref:glycosyltransferase n=1 Tax=Occallatibacter savannae TaxID=1002691 RepID=UPI000D6912BA|nr:glycosyltransferase [Occallatibacter savannae]
MIDISVILCTYNRCESLARALESLVAMNVQSTTRWEILVVDNNSKDSTADVIDDFRKRDPERIHRIFEPSQGKSFALNAGIQAAKGRVLAFIDDDVVANASWLQRLTADIVSGKAAGAGGKILLDPAFEAPSWLSVDGPQSLGGMLAVFNLGDERRLLDRPPFGTNMAFNRSMFEKYGLFRTDMGPAPGSEIRNEDVEFCRRLMNGGEVLQYEPEAIVYHAVPERRRRPEYFLRFWFDHGRAMVRECGAKRSVLGIPGRYLSIVKAACWEMPISAVKWLSTRDARTRFYRKGWLWMLAGEISEWRHSGAGRGTAFESAPKLKSETLSRDS